MKAISFKTIPNSKIYVYRNEDIIVIILRKLIESSKVDQHDKVLRIIKGYTLIERKLVLYEESFIRIFAILLANMDSKKADEYFFKIKDEGTFQIKFKKTV